MRRLLVNILATLSAVLCLAMIVMSVRSLFVGEQWGWRVGRYDVRVSSGSGQFWIHFAGPYLPGDRERFHRRSYSRYSAELCLQSYRCHATWPAYMELVEPTTRVVNCGIVRIGVGPWQENWFEVALVAESPWPIESGIGGAENGEMMRPEIVLRSARVSCVNILCYYWLLGLIFLILPLVRVRRYIRQRRRYLRGLCLHCGYDLRASKDRCPECGRVIEKLRDAVNEQRRMG